MTRFNLRVTPLTPVLISSGQSIEPFTYIVRRGHFHALSLDRLVRQLLPIPRQALFDAMDAGIVALRQELSSATANRDLADLSLWEASASEVFETYINTRRDSGRASLDVRTFMRSTLGAYLPGSSLKGALRTALLSEETTDLLNAHETPRDLAYAGSNWLPQIGDGRVILPSWGDNDRRWGQSSQLFEATVFRNIETRGGRSQPDLLRDPLRTLALGDSNPIPETHMMMLEIWGTRHKPGRPETGPEKSTGITIPAETWTEGSVEMSLRIDEARQAHMQRENSRALGFTIEDIAQAAYDRYFKVAEFETDVYEERQWEEAIQSMYYVLEKFNECVGEDGNLLQPYRFPLRLGFGTGDVTVRLTEFTEDESVSRTLAEELPLGWVMVEVD